ncbi:hypothetical protein RCO48_09650 [Peribacillus frigoritolerans]|nr:hypothetical protein [Peribacillus frigoritolerans]
MGCPSEYINGREGAGGDRDKRGVTDRVAFQAISGRMNELHFERMQLAFGRGRIRISSQKKWVICGAMFVGNDLITKIRLNK